MTKNTTFVFTLPLFAALFCAALLASCASTPSAPEPSAPPPEWFLDVNAVYPAARYIAQRGRGASREAAETEGIAAISRYFSSEMSANTRTAYTNVQQNGVDNETILTETDNYVQSHTKLFAVRYAQDPYRNPQTGQWETVAYIEREEAWESFEPEAKKLGDSFLAMAREADAEEDPLKRFFALRAAERYAQSPDYTRTVAFGQLLAPARMNAAFAEPRAAESALAQKTDAARREATIFVDCPVDSDSLVASALTKALGAEGFAAAKTREDTAAICLASVTEGARTDSSGITAYFPSVKITLAGKSGESLFSCSIAAERQAAMTAEVAKRRAYTALAQAVADNFSRELNENFGKQHSVKPVFTVLIIFYKENCMKKRVKTLPAMLAAAAMISAAIGLASCASKSGEPERPPLETAPVSVTNMTDDAYRSKIVDWQNRNLQMPSTPKWLVALAQGDDQVVKDMYATNFTGNDLGSDAVIKLIIVQNPNLATAQAQALTGTSGLAVKLSTEMRTTMSMEAGSSLNDDQQSTAMTAAAKARFDVSGLRAITDWWQQVETYNAEGRRSTQYLYYAVYAAGRAQWQTLTRAYMNQVLNELMKDNANRSAAQQIARQFDQITEASAKNEAWNKDEIAYQRQLAQEARQDANTARDQQYQRDMQADRLAAANQRTQAQTQQAQIQASAATEQAAIAPERQKAIAASTSGGDIDWVAALSTAADVIL